MADTYPHGLFTWADLATADPQASKAFYGAVFGWEGDDQFFEDGSFMYSLLRKDDKLVAGLGAQPQDMQEAGVPPSWNSYINVDDVDDVVAKVEKAGGTVMSKMDVLDSGRMAFVQDPTGAFVGLWQPGTHRGADVFAESGAMSWNELNTCDSAAAREFFGQILPWEFELFPGDNEYYVIHLGDQQNGGILTMNEEWPPEMHPHWMVYFNVDNVDETVAKIEEAGGSLAFPAFVTPVGKIGVIHDPHGAVFSIIAPSQAEAPTEA